ncbi:MAG TPA: MFS transporter, partial [bacterium]|nr:MFS transporter [bacterium]
MLDKRTRFHYGWVMLTMAVLVTLSSIGLARFGYTMILPAMQRGLDLSNTQTGALATANFIGYLVLALVGGFLASYYGPKRVIALSLGLVGVSMILTGFSKSFAQGLLWRAMAGIGSGASNVPMMGLLAAWFAPRRRGLATGIAVSGSSLGLIVTGPLVPLILNASELDGWRWSWFILGGFVLLVAVVARFFLQDRPSDRGLLPVGAAPAEPAASVQGAPLGMRSLALVHRSPIVWKLSLIYTAFGFSYIVYATFFAKYLQSEVGLTRQGAGRLWLTAGWISLFCGLLWGWISDLIGRRSALILVNLIHATAYLIFALWTEPLGRYCSVVLFGLTAWSIPAIMAAACG